MKGHIYYQELVKNAVSIAGMSVRDKLAALEYAKQVRDREDHIIQLAIVGNPSYKYPKEYLPDRKFDYWESREGKFSEAVRVIDLIEVNLPSYNKPGQEQSPPVEVTPEVQEEVSPEKKKKKKRGDKEPKPASAETCALFHCIIEFKVQGRIKAIPYGREKDGVAIGRELYGIKDGERFYKEYKKLLRITSQDYGIRNKKPHIIDRYEQQMFALADKLNYPEFKGWWNTVIK